MILLSNAYLSPTLLTPTAFNNSWKVLSAPLSHTDCSKAAVGTAFWCHARNRIVCTAINSSWVHVPIGQSAVITLLLSLTAKSHPGSITVCPVEPLDGRPQRCLLGLVLFLSPLTALLIVQSAEWIDRGQGHIPSMHWLRGVQTGCWGITVWACHTKHCTFWHFNLSLQHRITVGIV